MQDCWFADVENNLKVSPMEVYNCGTNLLAEFTSEVFALLVECCEFLIQVNKEIAHYRGKYTVDSLAHIFSEFRRLTVEEVAAIGETCGEVMVKIPEISKETVYDVMMNLYSQVSFVNVCVSRAFRAVVPLILIYDARRKKY